MNTHRISAVCAIAVGLALVVGCASDGTQTGIASSPKNSDAAPKSKNASASAAQEPKGIRETPSKRFVAVANPSKVKFNEFRSAVLKKTTLCEKYRDAKTVSEKSRKTANEKSAAVIDQLLETQVRLMFPSVTVIPADAEFPKLDGRVLQIAPEIEHIRLVSAGARVWFGAMAGGSDILVRVKFSDSQNNELIADPQFSAGNNAYSGAYSMGATDNQIRDSIVRQISRYLVENK